MIRLAIKFGLEFIDELIKILNINFLYDVEELQKRVPKSGPVIVVSNHPFGGLESILLIKILSQVRPDVKIVSTQLLQKIDPIREFFLEEDTFQRKNDKSTLTSGTDPASAHLENGGILCLSPGW